MDVLVLTNPVTSRKVDLCFGVQCCWDHCSQGYM